MTTTRTIGPLHFEDLEPHRFEDLVRQLTYDFRDWYELAATGRSGTDGGVDILATERFVNDEIIDDESGEERVETSSLRTWVIQCKREKSIPPKKIASVVSESLRTYQVPPYGFILAASADFSAAARSVFRQEMNDRGIQEFALWGKAELEDKLFEPRNDHLLFAYFGFSIQTRRRSSRTVYSSRLIMKRKLTKHLGEVSERGHKEILIRNIASDDYPHPVDPMKFEKSPAWRYYRFFGHSRHDHLAFVVSEHWAWVKENERCWDALSSFDQGVPFHPRLFGLPEKPHRDENEEQARRYWLTQIPEAEQGTHLNIGLIHYDQIVLVDDIGDHFNEPPHLLVDYAKPDQLFGEIVPLLELGRGYEKRLLRIDDQKKVSLFPDPIPTMTDEAFSAALDNKKSP